MMQRIWTLSTYLFHQFVFSLSGLFFTLVAFVYYWIFFDPRQNTPEAAYYIFILGIFGAGYAFLVTLKIASDANRTPSYLYFIRLSSRIEYLIAILVSSLVFTLFIQLVLACLAVYLSQTVLTLEQFLQIPPIWLSLNITMSILAFHASDLVTVGWSRSSFFGVLLVLLFVQGQEGKISLGLADGLTKLSGRLFQQGLITMGENIQDVANWLYGSGTESLTMVFQFVFHPFYAFIEFTETQTLDRWQALAPAILLLYAVLLFWSASDLLETKDLYLVE